ncbi:tRNA lysidine(34) synthetase TilS [Candidatus Peregrinibacteria bacterium]|jgi:tRNA(Ile)-lysidine synthase|nr:tRNA lysidine(34) synthetase TilS [Candidatus Peregrinibacteria bacterium]MBT7483404.1 tRNA lysidine(34) synthetase TilS [Candidatus Peregrinibacteria bacterium]MBT7703756.1 tRNA lysidine(34) synthetase TilS [Candidatus Peregrinibacteria bacterium]
MKKLILAISGGADSVYLLHKLLKDGTRPILAHFNHQLRGKESETDEKFVRNLAIEHNLKIEVETTDVAAYAKTHKKSLEEAGRILRYDFFERMRQKHAASEILLAHHLNDNLETVLMNKMRGCHLRGRIGMRATNKHLSRPLLQTPKSEILAHLTQHNLPYREDSTNQNTDFLRNWVRLELIPELLKKNPDLLADFQKNRKKALAEYDDLSNRAQKWWDNRTKVSTKEFTREEPEFQSFLLAHLYEQTYGSTNGLSRKNITEVLTLITRNLTGKQKQFGSKLTVRTEYGQIKFTSTQKDSPKIDPKTLPIAFDRVPQGILKKRTWQPGDRFQPSGMKGTKKLQDYFTDSKIPRTERQNVPIFTTKNDKIVAVGTRVDERFKT